MEAPWIAIADENELAPAQMKKVEAGGKRLLLANAEGSFYVVDEMCSHEDYSLYLGCIKGRTIKCSLHGSFFDLETGEPTVEPACEPIRTYPVAVADGKIWVNAE
jgi:3-phenylpropionate/trans-cinnamate dioxygenase ferredoxin subunit